MTKRRGGVLCYHEGVLGEQVSAWHSGGPSWRAWVRRRGPSAEPAADSPNYEDSEMKEEEIIDNESSSKVKKYKTPNLVVTETHAGKIQGLANKE